MGQAVLAVLIQKGRERRKMNSVLRLLSGKQGLCHTAEEATSRYAGHCTAAFPSRSPVSGCLHTWHSKLSIRYTSDWFLAALARAQLCLMLSLDKIIPYTSPALSAA